MIIKLTSNDGRDVYIDGANISRINETGESSQWHGTRAIVRTFDGAVIECQEDAKRVAEMVVYGSNIEAFRDRCIDIVAMHGGSVEIEAAIRALPL